MEEQELELNDADVPFQEIQEEIDTLQSVQPAVDASALVDVDSCVAVVQPLLSDADIIADCFGTDDIPDKYHDGDV